MRLTKKHALLIALILPGLLVLSGCAELQQLASSLLSLQKLQFKLGSVHDFNLLGIRFGAKSTLRDFSAMDGFALVQGFQSKRLPAEFVLDIQVRNPNDGSGGTRQTISTLTSLESRLLIDGKTTVTGNIDKAMEIPGTGQATIIPIRLSLDLYEFFGNNGYDELLGLALAIGGRSGSSSRLTLDAQPRVTTPFGEIVYPGRITIVDKEFH
jgi:hypothetical protein